MKQSQRATLNAVAKEFGGKHIESERAVSDLLEIAGKRIAISRVVMKDAEQSRLRFDRVATGFISGLQAAMSAYIPTGKIVVVTVTAPIWKASTTAAALKDTIRNVLAARRAQLDVSIHRNQIRIRVLNAVAAEMPTLVGFVHNPIPQPAALFGLVRSLLACVSSDRGNAARGEHDRWLVIVNQRMPTPGEMMRHVCSALCMTTVFSTILLESPGGEITLLKSPRNF